MMIGRQGIDRDEQTNRQTDRQTDPHTGQTNDPKEYEIHGNYRFLMIRTLDLNKKIMYFPEN